jgi:hypothetical protein
MDGKTEALRASEIKCRTQARRGRSGLYAARRFYFPLLRLRITRPVLEAISGNRPTNDLERRGMI